MVSASQMARAVPLFNLVHHPAATLVVIRVATSSILSAFWLVCASAGSRIS